MSEQTHAEITELAREFFLYFRKRVESATSSDLPHPDRMILLTACLDALANHWHATADRAVVPAKVSGAERMRLFLQRHGQHAAFNKVSAPLLRDIGKQTFDSRFPFNRYRVDRMNLVSDWHDDPDFAEMLDAGVDPIQVTRWSYGGVIYKDLRNAWVHQFFATNDQVRTPDVDILQRAEPYYRYIVNRQKFLLIFPLPFITRTCELAVQSFEVEVSHRQILPFKE